MHVCVHVWRLISVAGVIYLLAECHCDIGLVTQQCRTGGRQVISRIEASFTLQENTHRSWKLRNK